MIWKFILLNLFVHQSFGALENFPMPVYSSGLTKAITDIILNFYAKESTTINMIVAAQSPEAIVTNNYIVNEVMYHTKDAIMIQLEGFESIKTSHQRKYNIMFVDNYESFLEIFKRMDPQHFMFQGYFLIVITQYSEQLYATMQNIFEHLWSSFIVNVNIVWMPPENLIDAMLYTYFPYTIFYCEKVVPILVNQYAVDRWIRAEVHFPRKMKNLFGCRLRVVTFQNVPFMIINVDKNGIVSVDGIEGILLRVLSQRMHFDVELLLESVHQWGELYSNGTANGAIAKVINREANFTLGYFASNSLRATFMAESFIYFTSNLVWILRLDTSISSHHLDFIAVVLCRWPCSHRWLPLFCKEITTGLCIWRRKYKSSYEHDKRYIGRLSASFAAAKLLEISVGNVSALHAHHSKLISRFSLQIHADGSSRASSAINSRNVREELQVLHVQVNCSFSLRDA